MSREIKFRAWDGERLRSVNTIGWTNGEVDWLDTPKYHGPIDEDIKLMQYTGIKDKCGVEIYEGDILKITCDFKAGRKEILFDKVELTQCSWGCSDWFFFELIDNQLSGQQSFEVIGNIYENPELMEASK